MKKTKWIARVLAIILALAMICGSAFYLIYIVAPASYNTYALDAADVEKLYRLEEVIKMIENNYRDKLKGSELVDAAYQGVFDALDKWSVYYASKDDEAEFTNQLTGEKYAGVGMTIVDYEGQVYVCDLNTKGPAYGAGVQVGDIITAINGASIKKLTLDQVQAKLRGKAGTSLTVKLLRDGKTISVKLVRKELTVSSVRAKIFDSETGKEISDILNLTSKKNLIGYIKIDEFDDGTARAFATELQILKSAGITKLIIDLRDNPGGYMNEALECVSNFLKKGTKLTSYIKQGKTIGTEKSYQDGQYKFNMVLLVDEASASASDAFAAIFKDYKLGKIVGENTFGKGVAQEIFRLSDGSSMKLSTCYFTTPKGKQIHEVGTKPDIEVVSEHDMTEMAILKLEDLQLKKALEVLK